MNNPLIKAVIALAVALYIVFSIPVFVMAGLLLIHGETCQGRLFAIAVIVPLPVPVLMWFITYYIKRKQVYLISATTLIILSILLLGINYAITPDGLPLPNSPVRSCFTGASSYQRTSMANMVPEMDQLILATYVIPSMDVLMDKPHTSELRNQIRAVYGEMRRNPEFESLNSVLGQTYRQLFLGKPTVWHFYEYIPANKQGCLPVVIFLHGSFGNLKGYLWVWKRIADEYGFTIVAPTFGMGNWESPGGDKVIEEALRYCTSHPRMDSSRVYLAGLST